MWLYFNKNGQLLEMLEHGPQPRAGTTDFEIFAYFEGMDELVESEMPNASITIFKPDLDRWESVPFFMSKVRRTYHKLPDEHSYRFKKYEEYKGYELDFGDLDGALIFDQPGIFKCYISLYKELTGAIAVQGSITISVGNGTSHEGDGEDIPESAFLRAVYAELERKMPYRSGFFIKVVPSIAETDFTDRNKFGKKDKIFAADEQKFYELDNEFVPRELEEINKKCECNMRPMTDEEIDAIDLTIGG